MLVERELNAHMANTKQTGKQAPIEAWNAFLSIYSHERISCVPISLRCIDPALSLNYKSGGMLTDGGKHTMKRVLITQSGFVAIVLDAPATTAANMCPRRSSSLPISAYLHQSLANNVL